VIPAPGHILRKVGDKGANGARKGGRTPVSAPCLADCHGWRPLHIPDRPRCCGGHQSGFSRRACAVRTGPRPAPVLGRRLLPPRSPGARIDRRNRNVCSYTNGICIAFIRSGKMVMIRSCITAHRGPSRETADPRDRSPRLRAARDAREIVSRGAPAAREIVSRAVLGLPARSCRARCSGCPRDRVARGARAARAPSCRPRRPGRPRHRAARGAGWSWSRGYRSEVSVHYGTETVCLLQT
jgi:hypothetical protein